MLGGGIKKKKGLFGAVESQLPLLNNSATEKHWPGAIFAVSFNRDPLACCPPCKCIAWDVLVCLV